MHKAATVHRKLRDAHLHKSNNTSYKRSRQDRNTNVPNRHLCWINNCISGQQRRMSNMSWENSESANTRLELNAMLTLDTIKCWHWSPQRSVQTSFSKTDTHEHPCTRINAHCLRLLLAGYTSAWRALDCRECWPAGTGVQHRQPILEGADPIMSS